MSQSDVASEQPNKEPEDADKPDEKPDKSQKPEGKPGKAADVGAGVKGILTTTQDRVAAILAATESAAADIVEAANAESAQIVKDTHATAENLAQSRIDRIDSVTEAVLTKASELERELDALRELVSKSTDTLAEDWVETSPAPKRAARTAGVVRGTTGTVTADGQDAAKASGLLNRMRSSHKRDSSEGVKLLAAQMIAAGHSKEEARQRLSEEFGVDPTIAEDAIETGVAAN